MSNAVEVQWCTVDALLASISDAPARSFSRPRSAASDDARRRHESHLLRMQLRLALSELSERDGRHHSQPSPETLQTAALTCLKCWQVWTSRQRREQALYDAVVRRRVSVVLRRATRAWQLALRRHRGIRTLKRAGDSVWRYYALVKWKQSVWQWRIIRRWQYIRDCRRLTLVLRTWKRATVAMKAKRERLELVRQLAQRLLQHRSLEALKRGARVYADATQLLRRRLQRLRQRCLAVWGEFVERQKRCAFAAQWSRHHACACVFDHWNAAVHRRKQVTQALRAFRRRKRRQTAQRVFIVWTLSVRTVQCQRHALLVSSSLLSIALLVHCTLR